MKAYNTKWNAYSQAADSKVYYYHNPLTNNLDAAISTDPNKFDSTVYVPSMKNNTVLRTYTIKYFNQTSATASSRFFTQGWFLAKITDFK
jgi:hypothetical protein